MTIDSEYARSSYPQVTLEKIAFGLEQHISPRLLQDAHVKLEKILGDNIEMQLRGYLWGEQWPEREAARYPSDWWQALKERWFPRWARQRWPVRYTIVKVRANVVYPDKRISLPADRYVVPIYVSSRLDMSDLRKEDE